MWMQDHEQYTKSNKELALQLGEKIPLCPLGLTDKGPIPLKKWSTEDLTRYTEIPRDFGVLHRDLDIICVDIDGKNGAMEDPESLRMLELLPPTLAERSKSGNGYHLFYKYPEATKDIIGLTKGIDIKAYGLTYSLGHQKNNGLKIRVLPPKWRRTLERREQEKLNAANTAEIKARYIQSINRSRGIDTTTSACEYICTHAIPTGQRNTRVFAMGMHKKACGYGDWQIHVQHAGELAGLEAKEIQSIIKSILKREVI